MKTECEKCNKKLNIEDVAYACNYECTFCEECTKNMNEICPNCNGKLLKRQKSNY